ncbi:MAG: DUF3943 domain-containing protein [Acidobacteriota bacterium]|nr:DUF3943 domain-containing protein [Acidobacteriota bacterium]
MKRLSLLLACALAASEAAGNLAVPPSSEDEASQEAPAPAVSIAPKKDFAAALLEGMAFNVIPLAWNRFVLQKEMGLVTWDTWRDNLNRGFAYDPDKFVTNVLSHPQHGGLYYDAARANGFNLYESFLFTAFGSLTWEYFGEKSRPSTSDLITTSFGGVSAGETSYRLSDLVFDNTATGFSRFLHELGGLAVSPGRVFQRLLSGDAWRVGPNPEGTQPEYVHAELLGGGLVIFSERPDRPDTTQNRGTIAWDVRYGDPFEKDLGKPFSTFRLGAEFTTSKKFVSGVQVEGILAGRRLDDVAGDRTVLAAVLGYNFVQVDLDYGSQTLGIELASRIPVGKRYDFVPRVQILSAYTAVQTSEESVKYHYRNYDWGLGGGVSLGARLRRQERDVLRLDYTNIWSYTVNGPTVWNEVRYGQAAAFVPVSRAWALGAGYTFHQHRNVFPGGEQQRTSQQLRALVSWTAFSGKP